MRGEARGFPPPWELPAALWPASSTPRPSGTNVADGATFTVQAQGPTAVGGTGGNLAFDYITPAVGVVFNIYNGHIQSSTNLVYHTSGGSNNNTNGDGGSGNTSTSPVNIVSGDPIKVQLTYNAAAQTLTELLTDQTNNNTFTDTYAGVNFQSMLNSTTGYVGFTGSTGGLNGVQQVSNFTFQGGGGAGSYANTVIVSAGATAELNLGTANTPSEQVGSLAMNANSALSVTRSGSSTANSPYTIGAQATTLSGNAAFSVANNGLGLGTFSPGAVSGNGNLTMNGPGTLAMSSSLSSFVGNTIINGGNVAITNPASLGAAGNSVIINANGALEVATGFSDTMPITFNAPGAALQVDAGQTYSNSTTFAVANGGAVTKTGAGTLLMTVPLPVAPMVANGGVFDLGGLPHTVTAATFTSGIVQNGTLTSPSYVFNGPASVSATLQDGASHSPVVVNFSGSGAATLSGTNTYSGGTTVTQGFLAAGALSLGTSTVTLAGGTFQPTPSLSPGLLVNFYHPDAGQANSASLAALNAWLAGKAPVGTSNSAADGNLVLNFNGPNGNNGQAFNGTNGPGNIGYTDSQGGNNYTAVFTGYINLPAGVSNFTTRSDDGSMLFIDGNTVVNNNYYQGMTNRSGSTPSLTPGLHQIEIEYYQGGGGAGLEVFNDLTGTNVLSNSQLFSAAANTVFTNNVAVTADSSLSLVPAAGASFPLLTIGANTLHVTGGPATAAFTNTTFASSPIFDVQGSNVLDLGTVSGTSGFSEIGSGTVVLGAGSFSGRAAISGNGTLLAVGQNLTTGPLGSNPITLNNGTLALANASTTGTTFDMESGNAVTLSGSNDAIIAGSNFAGEAVVANGAVFLTGTSSVYPIAVGQTLNLGSVNGYTLTVDPALQFSNNGTISGGPGSAALHASNLPLAGTFSAPAAAP